MSTTIFYFSATGNSLQITRDIAKEMKQVKIVQMKAGNPLKPVGGAGESVGFVFPIYFNGMPRLVKDFIENLDIASETYCFAVVNSGGTRSNTLGTLDDILSSKNVCLSFADEIKMPTNYIIAHSLPNKDKIEQLLLDASKKAKDIANRISNHELKPAQQKAKLWSRLVNQNYLYKNASEWDEKFRVTEDCTGCGLCSKVCPAANIKIKNHHPFWLHHCEKCLACIHWCPCEAIEYHKSTVGRTRYHHPNIKVEDIIR